MSEDHTVFIFPQMEHVNLLTPAQILFIYQIRRVLNQSIDGQYYPLADKMSRAMSKIVFTPRCMC